MNNFMDRLDLSFETPSGFRQGGIGPTKTTLPLFAGDKSDPETDIITTSKPLLEITGSTTRAL